ncbi:MAG: helix-turn-helix transcriptional regulator [Deltaproteobacteria bacterium]|nr:helix-turn-helix transcriptional regulator [Deltaproteobacteria bacterium]
MDQIHGGHSSAIRRLSPRCLEVVELAARGLGNKQIAWELGVEVATVATHLARSRAKLGLPTRLRLIQELAAVRDRPPLHPTRPLSSVEIEVAIAALEGKSTIQIARERGRAYRTVANQLASVYRKLGIGSRLELAARWPVERGPVRVAA